MKNFLVGLKCYPNHMNWGCECTLDVPEEAKTEFENVYKIPYDRCCYYTIVEVEKQEDINLEECLHQQGATEYENAKEIWFDFDIIDEVQFGGTEDGGRK